MDIKMNSFSYVLDADSNTSAIQVGLSGYKDNESVNVSVQLDGDGLDDLTRKEIEAKARERVVDMFNSTDTEPSKSEPVTADTTDK